MATHTTIDVETPERVTTVDITEEVQDAIPAGASGTCTVFVRHTTAGVSINEAEPRLREDIETAVADLVPSSGWNHDQLDGNADAHLRSMLLGRDVTFPVVDGQVDLGTWQSVLLVECDGPRTRTVTVVTE